MTTATLEKPQEVAQTDGKVQIIETIQKGYDWMSGEDDVDREVTVAIVVGNKTVNSVSFREGEPEDMTLNRDLSDAYSISGLVRTAYELGRQGAEVEFISKEINEDEE